MKAVVFALLSGLVGFAQPVSAGEPATYSEKVLYSFGNVPDGQQPEGGVIDVKGTLYGTTNMGGNEGSGTVFALNPHTGVESFIHSFDGDPDAFPQGNLIDVKGTLYGTTSGGENSGGSVFILDPNTNTEKSLYTFCSKPNCTDGDAPVAGLTGVKNMLYGTTFAGGANDKDSCVNVGCGTVFSLDRSTGAETVIYSFCSKPNCADGKEPAATPIEIGGMLYGTTEYGGASGGGTAFSLDPKTGIQTVLHNFGGGQDGSAPSGLIDVNGLLFGTTASGGGTGCNGPGCGTVFSLDPNSGKEKVLYVFCSRRNCDDGSAPSAGLISANGTLYGTTFEGGKGTGCDSSGCGTVFSLDPKTGVEKVLYSFCGQPNCTDGEYPDSSLISVKGKLYGMTLAGGIYNYGTVFMLQKAP